MKKKDRLCWFWVWLKTITLKKKYLNKESAIGKARETLLIIQAKDPLEAYQKATASGKLEEGDCRGSLTLNGEPAFTKFLGIWDMGIIHEDFEDGAEILFRRNFQTLKKARTRIENKKKLIERIEKEMIIIK